MGSRLKTLGLLVALASCGESAGIPQPDPIPKVSLIRLSGPGTVEVIGLPGCVAGAGTVSLESQSHRASGPATASGSFALSILAGPDAEIAIRYDQSPPVSVRVLVPVPPPPSVPVPPGPTPGVPPLSSAGAGRVLIRGQSAQNPGGTILGVNPTLGEVVTTTTAADRRFSLELPASPGQQLRIYDDQVPLEDPWVLTAP